MTQKNTSKITHTSKGITLILLIFFSIISINNSIAIEYVVPDDFHTIQEAIDISVDGDTVLVHPGIYQENIDTFTKNISLKSAEGPEDTIIEPISTSFPVVTIGSSSEIDGFTIRGGSYDYGAAIKILNSNVNGVTITNNIIENNNNYYSIIFGDGEYAIINKNIIRNNSCRERTRSGTISFLNKSTVIITNNIIINNQCEGINTNMSTGGSIIATNNSIVNNRYGIALYSYYAFQEFNNNIFSNNEIGVYSRSTYDITRISFTNNIVHNNTINYKNIQDQTGINGNISLDPLFMNMQKNNFELTCDSPAIDAGTSSFAPLNDFNDNVRPQDGNGDNSAEFDIGAYEHTSGPCIPKGLTTSVAGEGNGTISSLPPGIDCPDDCEEVYPHGTQVILMATPDNFSTFTGWLSSECDMDDPVCTLTMNQYRHISAEFTPNYHVTVYATGAGNGSVTSTPGEIDFSYPSTSSATSDPIMSGTSVTVVATADTGSTVSWSNCWGSTGNGTPTATCTVDSIEEYTEMTATFTPTSLITVNASGTGSGEINSIPGEISFNYPAISTAISSPITNGTYISIYAEAGTGSIVTWSNCSESGGWASGNGTAYARCSFSSVDSYKTVTATFSKKTYTVTTTASGNGRGTVTSSPGDISLNYPLDSTATSNPIIHGTPVIIEATAELGTRISWSDCTSSGGTVARERTTQSTCTFSDITEAKNINVAFDYLPNTGVVVADSIGNGSGVVSSATGEIYYRYPASITATSKVMGLGTSINVEALAKTGATVTWDDCTASGGVASGTGTSVASCSFSSLDADQTVTANFNLNSYYITVDSLGEGSGTVSSLPGAIYYHYPTAVTATSVPIVHGSSVFIEAMAEEGSLAMIDGCESSGGALYGNGSSAALCYLSYLDADKQITTYFVPNMLSLSVDKTGEGEVTSNPEGISCGTDCSEQFAFGTSVTLTATPLSGSTFRRWSGDCSGTELTCEVAMEEARNVTAVFSSFPWVLFLPAILSTTLEE